MTRVGRAASTAGRSRPSSRSATCASGSRCHSLPPNLPATTARLFECARSWPLSVIEPCPGAEHQGRRRVLGHAPAALEQGKHAPRSPRPSHRGLRHGRQRAALMALTALRVCRTRASGCQPRTRSPACTTPSPTTRRQRQRRVRSVRLLSSQSFSPLLSPEPCSPLRTLVVTGMTADSGLENCARGGGGLRPVQGTLGSASGQAAGRGARG
jgi:hypothetical protein